VQERDLFGFFANAVAAIDSCCFAVYHIGRLARPNLFRLAARKVSVAATEAAVASAFAGSSLDGALTQLVSDAMWQCICNHRNILVHRESPARTLFMSLDSGYVPPPARWTKYGDELRPPLVEQPRIWLGHVIDKLVEATDELVRPAFP
jgi:hypothetical protein